MTIFTRDFWAYAGERALKTVAQAAIAFLGVGVMGVLDVDWLNLASVSLLAGVVSVLTSVANYAAPDDYTPEI